ncbi:MAG: nucleotide exchange factor GrpE [Gloeotrichia echinulata GP01]
MFNQIINWLFTEGVKEQQQVQNIVVKIEDRARQLSGLTSTATQSYPDLISRLKHIYLLLDRLVENSEIQKVSLNVVADTIASQSEAEAEAKLEIEEKVSNNEQTTPTFNTPPKIIPEPKLSKTAKELIELRDWVLLAKTGNNTPSPAMLDVLYQQLGKVLEKEGVTSLQENDKFDYERQQIVSTKVTDDPEKNDIVAETVRPGYIFNGSIIRPQEVIIYTKPIAL